MLASDPHGEKANNNIDEVFELYENDYYGQEDDDGYLSEEIKENDQMRRKGAFVMLEDEKSDGDWDDVNEPAKTMIKTLVPSSEQLASLNLQPGVNLITFSVKSRL